MEIFRYYTIIYKSYIIHITSDVWLVGDGGDVLLNQLGLVNLAIGNGTEETGDFTTIDWGADRNFYKSRLI